MKKEMIMKVILIIITMITIVHRNNYKNKKKPKTLTTKKRERERRNKIYGDGLVKESLATTGICARLSLCACKFFFFH